MKAKTTARLEERNKKSKYTGIRTRKDGNNVMEFTGLVFGGSNQEVVVVSPAARR